MQSASDDEVWKRLLEKLRFELAAEGVFRLERCYILRQHVQVQYPYPEHPEQQNGPIFFRLYPAQCINHCDKIPTAFEAEVFTGQMPLLSPNQQYGSNAGTNNLNRPTDNIKFN